jgi:hypothetical protein
VISIIIIIIIIIPRTKNMKICSNGLVSILITVQIPRHFVHTARLLCSVTGHRGERLQYKANPPVSSSEDTGTLVVSDQKQ